MYALDTCSVVERLDDEVLAGLVSKGYLGALPVDPGGNRGEPTSYVLVDGSVGCLRHGFIQPPAGLPPTTSPREQFRAAGVVDPGLLARASDRDPTFWAGRSTWNRVQGLWSLWGTLGFIGFIVVTVRLVRWWPRVAGSGACLLVLSCLAGQGPPVVAAAAGLYAVAGAGLLVVALAWAFIVTAGFAVRAGSPESLGLGALSEEQEAALEPEVRLHARGAALAALALSPLVPGLAVEACHGAAGAILAVSVSSAAVFAGGVLWAVGGAVAGASFPSRPGRFPWAVSVLLVSGWIWLLAAFEGALGDGGMGIETMLAHAVPAAFLFGRHSFSALILPAIARALRVEAVPRRRGKVLRTYGLSAHPSRGTV